MHVRRQPPTKQLAVVLHQHLECIILACTAMCAVGISVDSTVALEGARPRMCCRPNFFVNF